jgi:hypothetical protein
MKRLSTFIVISLSILLITFTSCDKVKELTNVEFDSELSKDINATSASETLKTGGYSFSGSAEIDPASEEKINKYWNLIKEWHVKEIMVVIKSIDEESNLLGGNLTITDTETEEEVFSYDASPMVLKVGATVLKVTNHDWAKIVDALKNKHTLLAEVNGSIDKPSINITFKIKINTHILANPF